ncbi:MAG: type II secretion system protein GspL [Silvania sp.]|uniref:type II secretion system protein GspL n=1 Tax=Silvania sp. TaxID=3016633 RepID=UPI003EE53670
MREQLVIRLASHAQQAMHWWLFSADRRLQASGQVPDAASLASLQHHAKDSPAIALVPTCDVVLRAVYLPGRLNRKTQKALPFLLEDEVVDEPEKLHVAVLACELPKVHLAAVDNTLMQTWRSWLDLAGLRVEKMLPDVFALPLVEGGCRWLLGDQHLIRESRWQGMVLEASLLAALPPGREAGWQTCGGELPLSVAHLPAVSLLQGGWQPQRQYPRIPGIWRVPGTLLALMLMLVLIGWGLEKYQQYRDESQLAAQMQALYQKAFPGSPPAGDPWREFNTRMARARSGFLPLVLGLDVLLPAGVVVQALQFDTSTQALNAQLSGITPLAMNAIAARLPPTLTLQTRAGGVTLSNNTQALARKVTPDQLPRVAQMAQQLQQMKGQTAQKSAVSAPDADLSALITQTRKEAHLPALTLVKQGKGLELRFGTAVHFASLIDWLQTLDYHYGIVARQVELNDKGQGNVEVTRLALSRGQP